MTAVQPPTLHPDARIPKPYPGEFLRGIIGSTIHGLALPGTDDFDLMGVCIEPVELALTVSPKNFEQHIYRSAGGSNPSRPGDVDLTVYSLKKFLQLALNGNPTILNLLFVPTQFCSINTPIAEELRELTPHIVSKEAGPRYLGYMQAQKARLLGLKGQKRGGQQRIALEQEHGYDTKYAMHMLRIGIQGFELMQTGRITLPMSTGHRELLMGVRTGATPKDRVLQWASEIEAALFQANHESTLQNHPQRGVVGDWMRKKYLQQWEKNRDVGQAADITQRQTSANTARSHPAPRPGDYMRLGPDERLALVVREDGAIERARGGNEEV